MEKFDSSECALNTSDMPFEPHLLKPLSLLAKAFENSGEYHKSVSIYLYLIKNIISEQGKLELMGRLGNTYLHAGFLERAKSIYMEILRKKPRNVKVLYELGVVYEMMHKFEKAREVIEPLEQLGEDTYNLDKFLELSQIKANKNISSDEKIAKLLKILEDEPELYREVISILLKLNTKAAWENIDTTHIDEILDILWFLPNSQVDLDIISSNNVLHTLYYVKGYVHTAPKEKSSFFTLDMLATAKKSGFEEGELLFSYMCKKCKQSFPASFKRCPSCMAINSIKVEERIAKKRPKTNYSLL
ncbi:Putative periplasmic protein [hydrothermal vent metagenome]|uniref:Putative periplasmic protein n=1 Tax=hydrothermal vent metagenome TaxID=652676 RepID=A0A1W1EBW6_9ZZZZ